MRKTFALLTVFCWRLALAASAQSSAKTAPAAKHR